MLIFEYETNVQQNIRHRKAKIEDEFSDEIGCKVFNTLAKQELPSALSQALMAYIPKGLHSSKLFHK